MKNTFFLLFIFIILACANKEEYAEINTKLDNTKFIEVKTPIDDISLWEAKTDTIYPNENNEFIFKKKIEKPEFAVIKIGKKRLNSILLPNNKIKIAYVDSTFVFKGKSEEGLTLLNEFKRPYFNVSESNKYKSDSTASQITGKINVQKEEELRKLQALIDSTKIEKQFADVLKDEIDYFYALRTQQVILSKQYDKKEAINKDLINLFQATMEKYPLDREYKSSCWLEYAETILVQKPLYLESQNLITPDSLQKLWENDKLIPFKFNLIKKYENPVISEKVAADFIKGACKQMHFKKSILSVFKDFQKTYPNSVYTKYLKSDVDIIDNYYKKIARKLPDYIKIIDGENIATFDELLSKLKENKYYVDVWATWCGPCKREFKFNNELNALLKKKGYKKLYISIDKKDKEKKWKQDVNYYDLNGLHMMANQDFVKHFQQNYTIYKGYLMIPQYLIIDEKGKIVTNNAPRPSNLKKLEKLLSK